MSKVSISTILKEAFKLTNAPFEIYTGKQITSRASKEDKELLAVLISEYDLQPGNYYIVDTRDGMLMACLNGLVVEAFNDEARSRWQEFQHRLDAE